MLGVPLGHLRNCTTVNILEIKKKKLSYFLEINLLELIRDMNNVPNCFP